MEALVEIDKALFLWLNGLGSPSYDGFWMVMTHRASNVVLYFFLWLYFIYKTNWKSGVILLVFTGVLILCTDQFTNLVKATAGRLRPCYDEEIKVWVRLVKQHPAASNPRKTAGVGFVSSCGSQRKRAESHDARSISPR